jgi:hypothetical protein
MSTGVHWLWQTGTLAKVEMSASTLVTQPSSVGLRFTVRESMRTAIAS